MKKSIKDLLKKNLSVDRKLIETGKWVTLGPGIELLCRPITLHNKRFTSKLFKSKVNLSDFSDRTNDVPERTKKDFANVLQGTVILAIRDANDHKVNEILRNSSDIYSLMKDYDEHFGTLIIRLMSNKEFALVEALEAKN